MHFGILYFLVFISSCESVNIFQVLANIFSKLRIPRISAHADLIPTQATNTTDIINSLQSENYRLLELSSSLRTKLSQYKAINADLKRNQDQANVVLSQQITELRAVYERDVADYKSSMASKYQQETETAIAAVKKTVEIDYSSQIAKMQQDYDHKINSLNETIKKLEDEKIASGNEIEMLKARVDKLTSQLEEKMVGYHLDDMIVFMKTLFLFLEAVEL